MVALLKVFRGFHQQVALLLQLAAHQVEGLHQPVKIPLERPEGRPLHLIAQFSLRDAAGAVGEAVDGRDEPPR